MRGRHDLERRIAALEDDVERLGWAVGSALGGVGALNSLIAEWIEDKHDLATLMDRLNEVDAAMQLNLDRVAERWPRDNRPFDPPEEYGE
ncbi:MAG TPA: hypothetical protein VGH79_08950 [Gaiellaceae bacterium]|jgi:hypothetical protein